MSDWHDCGHAGGSRLGPVVLIPGRQVVLDFSHVVRTGTMLQTVVQVCKIGIVLARIGLGCSDRGRLQTIRTGIKLAGLFRLAGLYRIRLGMVRLGEDGVGRVPNSLGSQTQACKTVRKLDVGTVSSLRE